jgi:ribosomal protein L11 methyltransferase
LDDPPPLKLRRTGPHSLKLRRTGPRSLKLRRTGPRSLKLRRTGARSWPALIVTAAHIGQDDLIVAILDDFSPAAIEDLAPQLLPPGGLWDPTFPPLLEAPAAVRWRVFFHTAEARRDAEGALRERLPDITIENIEVADDDWAARSQRSLVAIRAGAFIVAPPWDVPSVHEAGVTTIIIEPSRGFGTGHHASTRLCLKALSDIDVSGKRVLDLGTGSGVLAMATALKGAREVVAVDVDPDAIEAATQSVALNALPIEIAFELLDFRSASHSPADVVLANLTGGMLMASADQIVSFVARGGLLVMSGFDESERDIVRRAFANMAEVTSLSEETWVALVLSS